MKKPIVLCTVFFIMGGSYLFAQDTLSNGKALNFPTRKYGISIGNSYEFTGIRINSADENVKRINGLNVTFWFKKEKNEDAVVNGIGVGVMQVAGIMQPINIGLLGLVAKKMNGLSIGGFFIGGGNINGLSVSGLATMAESENSVISGISISGLCVGAEKAINGLAIGGLAAISNVSINGAALSLAYVGCGNNFKGVGVTGGYLESDIFKGLAIAGYAKTNQMHGLSIALFNRTKELHGIQLGLVNYTENNPKGLRILPFINLHL
jgi:hypothetical protein